MGPTDWSHDGADSYVIEDGRIVAQSIHFSGLHHGTPHGPATPRSRMPQKKGPGSPQTGRRQVSVSPP